MARPTDWPSAKVLAGTETAIPPLAGIVNAAVNWIVPDIPVAPGMPWI
jgi:hypothetical protein